MHKLVSKTRIQLCRIVLYPISLSTSPTPDQRRHDKRKRDGKPKAGTESTPAISVSVTVPDARLKCRTEIVKQVRNPNCHEEGDSLKERRKNRDFCSGVVAAAKNDGGHVEEECYCAGR